MRLAQPNGWEVQAKGDAFDPLDFFLRTPGSFSYPLCIVQNTEKENGKPFLRKIYLTSLDRQSICPTITTGTPTGSYHL